MSVAASIITGISLYSDCTLIGFAELTQLFIQYQPNLLLNSGNTAYTPIKITETFRASC